MKPSRWRILFAVAAFLALLLASTGSGARGQGTGPSREAAESVPSVRVDAIGQLTAASAESGGDADSLDSNNASETPAETPARPARLGPVSTSNVYTPLLASVVSSPIPMRGSDGTVRLAYELKVANATGVDVAIKGVNVLDPLNSDAVALSLSEEDVAANLLVPGSTGLTSVLGPGQSGLLCVNAVFPAIETVPAVLDHLITVSTEGTKGVSSARSVERIARTEVNLDVPVTIGPPVEGDRWIAVAGCCDSYHRFSAIPLNGEWRLAERFAIDWVRLDKHYRLVTGDPKTNRSYPQYGSRLIAVADGLVSKVQDGIRDGIPGRPHKGLTAETTSGNYVVLDLGYGLAALYAHLKRGSIVVREGEWVRKGQLLGLLGNSGNSDAPHLHFQVMAGQLALASDGVPYVIDSFTLKGRVVSSDDLVTQLKTPSVPVEIQTVEDMGERRDLMPSNLSFIEFPARSRDEKR